MPTAPAVSNQVHAVQRRLCAVLYVGALCVLGELVAFALRRPGHDEPPSMWLVFAGMAALFFGAWTIYRVNHSGGRLMGRFGGLIVMILGLISVPIFARELARWEATGQKTEIANLSAIAAACKHWAARHGHRYPPNLAALIARGSITPGMLCSPLHGMTAPPLPPHLKPADWKRIATQVAGYSDYQYWGANLTKPLAASGHSIAGRIILLFRNEQDEQAGGPIAFANGRVRWINANKMPELIAKDNAARKALGLPALTFDSDAPRPPVRGAGKVHKHQSRTPRRSQQ